jgi:hypothetical protein
MWQRPVRIMLFLRFANALPELFWNRISVRRRLSVLTGGAMAMAPCACTDLCTEPAALCGNGRDGGCAGATRHGLEMEFGYGGAPL